MIEYQPLTENIPAILRGFAILGVVACIVAFVLTFITSAGSTRKNNEGE